MHTYCVFCQTQKTRKVAEKIERYLKCRVINPSIIQKKWVKGKATSEKHDYLPGYIFVYTEDAISDFMILWRMEGLIRVLGDPDRGCELEGQDLSFAQALYDTSGVIGFARGYEEGDRVVLKHELFDNFAGKIKKVDRGRQRALIQFEFDGILRNTWVGYEMIEKDG